MILMKGYWYPSLQFHSTRTGVHCNLFIIMRRTSMIQQVTSALGRPLRPRCFHMSTRRPDRPGAHKTPIVDYLWGLRDAIIEKENIKTTERAEKEAARAKDAKLSGKSAGESFTSIDYLFSTDMSLREKYLNPWGKIRIGRVVEDLDALAGNISFKHAKQSAVSAQDFLIVTASIDRIVLGHRPNLKDDIELCGGVSWVGRSSMEIKMHAKSSWTDKPWLSALFTFVALDRVTGAPAQLPPLLPEGDSELKDFKLGQERNALRKRMRKDRSRMLITSKRKGLLFEHEHPEARHISLEEAAEQLFKEARPLLDLPCLAPRETIPISKTSLNTALIMQPQQRNTAGRIFGGFLVRKAYELAYATAYMFGGSVPRFRELDEVTFKKPIDVGDLVHFSSSVLYSSTFMHGGVPTAHIEVLASVIKPESLSSAVSNTFNFTFEFSHAESLRSVLPESYEESLKIVTRFQSDVSQKEEDDNDKVITT